MRVTVNRMLGLALGLTAIGVLVPARAEAADAAAGKKIFLDNKCNGCHTVKSESIAVDEKMATGDAEEEKGEAKDEKKHEPPNLSNVGNLQKAEFLDGWLRKKEMIEGRKHPKRFAGTPEEREALVAWLTTLKAGDADKGKAK